MTSLSITTAVTCPTVRIRPAGIAQAAATDAVRCEGRFTLGVGSGEPLNEHILGDAWPSAATRLSGEIGDGFCTAMPSADLVDTFRSNGGGDKTTQAGMKVCWADSEGAGLDTTARV